MIIAVIIGLLAAVTAPLFIKARMPPPKEHGQR